ncbi:UTP--glucose-1-phosphate uridylyltransferase GalU [Micrococcus terreus]|uniref:UTP--glucose-1-phosphate uridylyltransferase GalU n=1 Tax=Micrococcus terreus TaxID=574650 RepID=UPI0021A95141|nr:UTP--glucose-1-phosphate uridylyltransferase GalU [Micrococcus terreus]MCT2090015.1 UTP--glucose-1-phosphate uridylyltransferase GalU [Micrococcus terreus]MDK7700984.1 UTP--glucose-1-phosphate uridylyltransferase GalU [Micrococcus terreus]WOO98012.1 UTP--glucose-1-phosphate uridylyltransferase GalU [Micrococcus terreus]
MDQIRRPRARKAVIPAAGLGTRFLPATKAMPKEMLPVVDKPAIQYVVAEAAAAGLDDLLMVTGRSKRALEDHFDRVPALERTLELKGDFDRLSLIQEATNLGDIHYVRQGDARGLGHAVLCARNHVGHDPFAVLLGDDLIDEQDHLLTRMLDVQQQYGGSVVALMEVPEENISAYGVAEVRPVQGADDDLVKVHGLVEKPAAGEAPSNLAIIGRYVLDPAVFDVLERTEPGRGNEIQLTDALQVLAEGTGEGFGVHAVVFRGRRYDTGDKLSYLKAVITLAAARDDLGPDLRAWIKEFAAQL